MAAAVASSVSSSETGVAADVELELSPLDDAIAVAVCVLQLPGRGDSQGREEVSLTHDWPFVRLNLLLLELLLFC